MSALRPSWTRHRKSAANSSQTARSFAECFAKAMTKKQKKLLRRILIAAVLFLALFFVPDERSRLRLVLYLIPYFIIGYKVLWDALRNIRHKKEGKEENGCD